MPTPAAGYYLKDGTRVPGTTTVIGRFKDSGALLFWAFKQGQSGQPTLYAERDKAADVGTFAHALVEARISGAPTPTPDPAMTAAQIAQALQAFDAYLSWERMTRLTIVAQEMQLVSEVYKFGGTPDAIGLIDDQLCLVDWKTSNGVFSDYLIQMAAYRYLWEEAHPEQPIKGGFHLCRFSKENGDFSHHYYPNLDEAWEAFVLMRRLYEIDKTLKKRAA